MKWGRRDRTQGADSISGPASSWAVAVDRPEFFVAAHLGVPATPGTVLLCPGSDFGISYEWPLDNWQELAEELIERGRKVTVAGVLVERARQSPGGEAG